MDAERQRGPNPGSSRVVVLDLRQRALRRRRELVERARALALLAEADARLLERGDDPADRVDFVAFEADVVGQLALGETGERAVLGLGAEDLAGVTSQRVLAGLREQR